MSAKEKLRPWAVGQVETGAELSVRDRVAEMCDVYLPVVTRLIRPARLRVAVERQEPMLPGYLFVDLRTVPDFSAIRDEPGFLYFVGMDGRPSRMSEEDLDEVKAVEGEADFRPQGKPLVLFVDGDVVRVKEGPFGDMQAGVSVDGRGQITLSGHDFPRAVQWSDLTNLEKCA